MSRLFLLCVLATALVALSPARSGCWAAKELPTDDEDSAKLESENGSSADDEEPLEHVVDTTRDPENGRKKCADGDNEFASAGTTGLPEDEFVEVDGDKFVMGCKEFIFAGWNQWEIMELASDAPEPFRYTPKCGREHIVDVMNDAVKSGLKVMRAWAHTITKGHETQREPGEYDEKILEGMDFIMDEAGKRGIKIIWVLADNWYEIGGIDSYVKWAEGEDATHEDFFTSPDAIQLYKDNIAFIANRENTINGKVYKEDPTIMAWNIANEARCQNCTTEVMHDWLEEICEFIKEEDENHLVGIGYEGFYHEDSEFADEMNPGQGWAGREGQNYIENADIDCVDYVGFHVWPDNWNSNITHMEEFIANHIAQGAELGKPVVMEEFGKIVEDPVDHEVRNEFLEAAFAVAEAEAGADGPLKGTLFWHWYAEGVGPGKYGIRKSHENTWNIIEDHADFMNEQCDEAEPVCAE